MYDEWVSYIQLIMYDERMLYIIINDVCWMGMLYIIINDVWWMGMLYIIIMCDEWYVIYNN